MVDSNFKKIVWLASYPKSGNTWVRAFLTAYHLKKGEELELNNLLPFSDTNPLTWERLCPIDLATMTVEDFATLKPSIIMQMIAEEGIEGQNSNMLLIKTHDANVSIQNHWLIPALFTIGAIYIIRDPRDIATSLSYHCNISVPEGVAKLINRNAALTVNIKTTHELHQILTSWEHHVNTWTMNTLFNVHMIRYEDMSSDPDIIFKQILTFLGIRYVDRPFKEALKQTNFDQMQMKEKKHGFKEKINSPNADFFRKGKVEGWRTELPKHFVYKIEEQCHVNMEKYGYKLSRPFGKYRYEKTEETFKGHEHRKFTNERN